MRSVPIAVCLLSLFLLAGCAVEHDSSRTADYSKQGVSPDQRKRDVAQCERRAQTAGGPSGRSVAMQQARTRECLRNQGYSHQRGYR